MKNTNLILRFINKIKIASTNFLTSYLLLGVVMGGAVAFQIAPSVLKNISNTPRVHATTVCPSTYTYNSSNGQCEKFAAYNTTYGCPSGGTLNGTNCDFGVGSIYIIKDIQPSIPSNTICISSHYSVRVYKQSNNNITFLCIPTGLPGFISGQNQVSFGCPTVGANNHYLRQGTPLEYLCVPNDYPGITSNYPSVTSPGVANNGNQYTLNVLSPNNYNYHIANNIANNIAAPSTTANTCPSGYTNTGTNCKTRVAPSFSCPAGQYLTNTTTDSCATCSINKYCTGGTSPPTACPTNTTAPAGSTSIINCSLIINSSSTSSSSTTISSSPTSSTTSSSNTTPITKLDIKVNLSGAYDTNLGNMRTNLKLNTLVPVSQPYKLAPFNYTGN